MRQKTNFRLNPALVEAAHRLAAICHKQLLDTYPAGDFQRDAQYLCYYRHVIRIAGEFTRWRTDGYRPVDWRRYRAERDEVFGALTIRLAAGLSGPFDGLEARRAGLAWEMADSPGRHWEMVILGTAAWAIARRAPLPQADEENNPL